MPEENEPLEPQTPEEQTLYDNIGASSHHAVPLVALSLVGFATFILAVALIRDIEQERFSHVVTVCSTALGGVIGWLKRDE